MMSGEITPSDKLAEIDKEIEWRRFAYPRSVAGKKMRQETADRRMAVIEAIREDYSRLVRETQDLPL